VKLYNYRQDYFFYYYFLLCFFVAFLWFYYYFTIFFGFLFGEVAGVDKFYNANITRRGYYLLYIYILLAVCSILGLFIHQTVFIVLFVVFLFYFLVGVIIIIWHSRDSIFELFECYYFLGCRFLLSVHLL
jgi:hypothetical protein